MNISNLETMDINLLFSIVNMKLRNEYADLTDLCESLGLDKYRLKQRLSAAGFSYSTQLRRFNRLAD